MAKANTPNGRRRRASWKEIVALRLGEYVCAEHAAGHPDASPLPEPLQEVCYPCAVQAGEPVRSSLTAARDYYCCDGRQDTNGRECSDTCEHGAHDEQGRMACNDCGRTIYATPDGNYHHDTEPERACFLIPAEISPPLTPEEREIWHKAIAAERGDGGRCWNCGGFTPCDACPEAPTFSKQYTRTDQAWYGLADHEREAGILAQHVLGEYGPSGCRFEFRVNWYDIGGALTPRVEIFDDAFPAFVEWRDVFEALAKWDEEFGGDMRAAGVDPPSALDPGNFEELLECFDFDDATPYAKADHQ